MAGQVRDWTVGLLKILMPSAGKGGSVPEQQNYQFPILAAFHKLFVGCCEWVEKKYKCLHEECSSSNEAKHEITAI